MFRDINANPLAKTVKSLAYGTLEDFLRSPVAYPAVLKAASGGGKRGRASAAFTEADKIRTGRRVSRGSGMMEVFLELVHRKRHPGYTNRSLHRRKFIVQDFIPGLGGDYKVLVFADKYFVVHRTNRRTISAPAAVAVSNGPMTCRPDCSISPRASFDGFDVPYISLDVALSGHEWHLLEFQCVQFGPAALQQSEHYFAKDAGNWLRIKEKSSLEREFVRSVMLYLQKLEQAAGDSGRS